MFFRACRHGGVQRRFRAAQIRCFASSFSDVQTRRACREALPGPGFALQPFLQTNISNHQVPSLLACVSILHECSVPSSLPTLPLEPQALLIAILRPHIPLLPADAQSLFGRVVETHIAMTNQPLRPPVSQIMQLFHSPDSVASCAGLHCRRPTYV